MRLDSSLKEVNLTASFKQVCIKSFKPGSVLVDSLISLTNSFYTELAETLILLGLTNQANSSSSLNFSTKSITASYGNYILMSLFFLKISFFNYFIFSLRKSY